MEIRQLGTSDREWAASLVTSHFGSSRVVSRGLLHETTSLPGLVALDVGIPAGLLHYRMHDGQCEVVVLIADTRRKGIGTALLESVCVLAQKARCRRLWLATTSNNQGAEAFYRAVGWRRVAVYPGAVREARKLKPEIPQYDESGAAIEDEIEYELALDSA